MKNALARPLLPWPFVAAVVSLLAVQAASAQSGVTFAVPGAHVTRPLTVNNRGEAAGLYSSETVENGAFVRDADGTISTVELGDATGFLNYMDLNISGTLVGTYLSTSVFARGFVRTPDGTTTPFDIPGAGLTMVTRINDRGSMIGAYLDSTLSWGAGFVVAPDGAITEIAGAEDYLYVPIAINTAGEVAGLAQPMNAGQWFGLFYRDARGTVTHFDIPNTPSRPEVTRVEILSVLPVDINASGIVTGYYLMEEWVGDELAGDVRRGFARFRDGTVETFGGTNSMTLDTVAGIDAAGGIVGTLYPSSGGPIGFHRSRNGRFTPIAVDGATSTAINGVSPSGVVVGTTILSDYNQSGQALGFILR